MSDWQAGLVYRALRWYCHGGRWPPEALRPLESILNDSHQSEVELHLWTPHFRKPRYCSNLRKPCPAILKRGDQVDCSVLRAVALEMLKVAPVVDAATGKKLAVPEWRSVRPLESPKADLIAASPQAAKQDQGIDLAAALAIYRRALDLPQS